MANAWVDYFNSSDNDSELLISLTEEQRVNAEGSTRGLVQETTQTGPQVDFSFIKEQEGFETSVYVPKKKSGEVAGQSGATIASGFDLGQRGASDLAGLPSDLVAKLKPYLGKKGASAATFVSQNPLSITQQEADTINTFAKNQELGRLIPKFDAVSSVPFAQLTPQQQTVVASVAFQYGNLADKTPNFWRQITTGDWSGALQNLRNFGDDYGSRRNREADYLESGMN